MEKPKHKGKAKGHLLTTFGEPSNGYKIIRAVCLFIIISVISLFFFFLFAVIADSQVARFVLPIISLPLLLFLAGTRQAFHYIHKKLHIYEDGIEFQYGEAYYFSTWENIGAIVSELRRAEDYDYSILRIYFNAPIIPETRASWEKLFYSGSVHNLTFLPALVFSNSTKRTPRIINIEALAQTEFGQYLISYAPHIFPVNLLKPSYLYDKSWDVKQKKNILFKGNTEAIEANQVVQQDIKPHLFE